MVRENYIKDTKALNTGRIYVLRGNYIKDTKVLDNGRIYVLRGQGVDDMWYESGR